MLDVHRLRVLVTLAETGTVTGTAERLHFSQSTVSHHLQRLQAETGAVLFTQVGRRLQLTAEGRHLVERGASVLAALDQLERDLRAMTSLEAGTLRMVCFPSAVPTLLPPILDELARRAPGLLVEVADAEPPDAAALLRSREADVALTFTYPDGPADSDLHCIDIGEDPLYLVTPATAGPAPETPAEVEDLARHREQPWIAGCQRCRGHLLAACRDAGFEPSLGYTSDDYLAVQALVAAGRGVTLLPGLALEAHRHPGVALRPVRSQARTVHACSLGPPPHTPAVALALQVAREVSGDELGVLAR